MTKLKKLYSTIQNLKELGFELDKNLLTQTNELEQEIIKGQLFPVLSNQKLNSYLKEIANLCGIQKNVTLYVKQS